MLVPRVVLRTPMPAKLVEGLSGRSYAYRSMRAWRNWQTRQV
jgi:hypothetical protein